MYAAVVHQQLNNNNRVTEPFNSFDYDAFKIEHYIQNLPYCIHIKHQTHKLILVLSNNSHILYRSPLEELMGAIDENQFNLFYYPAKSFELNLEVNGGECLIIHFDLHHWLSWLPQNDEIRLQLQEAILNKMGQLLYPPNPNINISIKNILQDIKSCHYENEYLRYYITAKVQELMVVLAQMDSLPRMKELDLPDEEVEKMYMAKNIITKNIAESCSIITLAQQVGTNECYLKRNFKKVFGDSVYQYLLHERMEKARDLLLNTDKKISAIAKEIGYKNASHFSVAYKKHYGVLPNQERGS